jgi:hypothetical protein
MNMVLLSGSLFWACSIGCFAQGNSPPETALPYSPTSLKLRTELRLDLPMPTAPATVGELIAGSNSPPREALANTDEQDTGLRSPSVRGDRFYLDQTVVKESDVPLVRGYNALFDPEMVPLGNQTLSCSVITAAKRKNPFCLLSPIFLNLSW